MSTITLPSMALLVAESQRRSNGAAMLFNTALDAGRRRAWWSALTRRPNALRTLEGEFRQAGAGHHAGLRQVDLADIRGSEGRSKDFDDQFNPLTAANRQRWQGVANAIEEGVHLPPVTLIQAGDDYYVRDGHHRISVSRALGHSMIEAEVTVWGPGRQG